MIMSAHKQLQLVTRILVSTGMLYYWLQSINSKVVSAFYTPCPCQTQQFTSIIWKNYDGAILVNKYQSSRLSGISEWRAKFSNIPTSNISTSSPPTEIKNDTLPLLLLPFTPTQILLPGQSTTLKFRHGKYMDIIDECINNYESVVGLSILDEDGLLPYVVICEVLEEEMEVNMGYRGFSSMEVGVRAVGRGKRRFVPTTTGSNREDEVEKIGAASFHGRTALDDIHLGQFVEWEDDSLSSDGIETASEYLGNIEELLMIPSQSSISGTSRDCSGSSPSSDGYGSVRLKRQQSLYAKAYETALLYTTAATHTPDQNSATYPKIQQLRHSQLIASSWAALAATDEGSGSRSSTIITQALATRDTVERLRLGLAVLLDSQMPDNEALLEEMDVSFGSAVGGSQGNTFQ